MIESTSMASLLTERCYRSTPRGVLTAHAWWLCQCETGACQYHWCSIYRGLERVGSWVPGGSVGRDQLAMAAKVRRHWFNPCRLGSRGHLGADFSLLLYTDLIKKRKPSRHYVMHQLLSEKMLNMPALSTLLIQLVSCITTNLQSSQDFFKSEIQLNCCGPDYCSRCPLRNGLRSSSSVAKILPNLLFTTSAACPRLISK